MLDAARVRFFANVAHELRTPLQVVLGQLDAAVAETDAEARAKQLRIATRNARRLQRLADQALELAQLDAGALEPSRQTFEVVRYLEDLVLSFGELAERRGILLEFIARPRTITCELDPHQLTTIVTNLLSNALRHTPGGGRIGVAVEAMQPRAGQSPGDRLAVTVADTGPGIAAERHAEVFERFRAPDGADRGLALGAGIGLALARELARIHEGTIRLESAVGRGSRFIVDLPLGGEGVLGTSAAPLLSTDGSRPEITAEILHRTTGTGDIDLRGAEPAGPTILVAEEHADLRALLREQFADVGQVIVAASGTAALTLARDRVPDLVVADARLPELDGLALCRLLRADERTSHIPVVLLGADASTDRRVEASEGGVDAFLAKPVEGRELLARVNALLASRRSLRERFREQVIITPADVSVESVDQLFFEKVMATIEERIGDPEFSVGGLATEMAMSVSQLSRKLTALVDRTPGQLMRSVRLERAAALVLGGAGNLSEIAYRVGFADQAHFSRSFKKHFGMTPSAYRESAGAG